MTKARIVRCDEHNVAVQIFTETEKKVKGDDGKFTKTGETVWEWKDAGYYGHRIDHAAESALFLSLPKDEPITGAMIKAAVAEIVAQTKGPAPTAEAGKHDAGPQTDGRVPE